MPAADIEALVTDRIAARLEAVIPGVDMGAEESLEYVPKKPGFIPHNPARSRTVPAWRNGWC